MPAKPGLSDSSQVGHRSRQHRWKSFLGVPDLQAMEGVQFQQQVFLGHSHSPEATEGQTPLYGQCLM